MAGLMQGLICRRITDYEYDNETGERREVERDAFRLNLANALFPQAGYALLPTYREILQADFRAQLRSVDFGQPTKAVSTINEWVAEQTEQKITDLLRPDLITPLTRLILVNAVYFMAEWLEPFDEASTRPGPFHLLPGTGEESVEVPMMHITQELRYVADDATAVEALDIPYKAMSMLVLLPRAGMFEVVDQAVTTDLIARIDERLTTCRVRLALPKFEMECDFALKETLQRLGLRTAFDQTSADFSGVTDDPQGLCVSEAIHRARIRVDEKGTEAAAATAVLWGILGIDDEPSKPIPFIVDRPFLFLIRDDQTKAILFMGRVVNPAERE